MIAHNPWKAQASFNFNLRYVENIPTTSTKWGSW